MTLAYNLSQLANNVNSSGQLDAATGLTNTSSLGFPSGTLMLFQQTAAPTGWTKQTTHNNKTLRVVSGTASSGGSVDFTSVFTNQTPTISSSLSAAATTLTTSQLASHAHAIGSSMYTNEFYSTYTSGNVMIVDGGGPYVVGSTPGITRNSGVSNVGGGSSHTHAVTGSITSSAIDLSIQYVDLIIAAKN